MAEPGIIASYLICDKPCGAKMPNMRSRFHWFVYVACCLGWLALLLIGTDALCSNPDEATQIAEIEANPDAYHLRQVTLKGRVHDVQILDPYFQPSGAACTGAYLFTLQDETGYLQVVVLGACGVPIARSLEVTEDDDIILQGVIHGQGRFGTFYSLDGTRRTDKSSPPLHVIAKEIHRLERPGEMGDK